MEKRKITGKMEKGEVVLFLRETNRQLCCRFGLSTRDCVIVVIYPAAASGELHQKSKKDSRSIVVSVFLKKYTDSNVEMRPNQVFLGSPHSA
eukprot:scaffold9217_cov150-Skeletonema_dohrnii-CCMP3373.AAC.6